MKKVLCVLACLSLFNIMLAVEPAGSSPDKNILFQFPAQGSEHDLERFQRVPFELTFKDLEPTKRGSWQTLVLINGARSGFLRGKPWGAPKVDDKCIQVTMHQNAVIVDRWGGEPESWVTYSIADSGPAKVLRHSFTAPKN